jgi:hypothetical protein
VQDEDEFTDDGSFLKAACDDLTSEKLVLVVLVNYLQGHGTGFMPGCLNCSLSEILPLML